MELCARVRCCRFAFLSKRRKSCQESAYKLCCGWLVAALLLRLAHLFAMCSCRHIIYGLSMSILIEDGTHFINGVYTKPHFQLNEFSVDSTKAIRRVLLTKPCNESWISPVQTSLDIILLLLFIQRPHWQFRRAHIRLLFIVCITNTWTCSYGTCLVVCHNTL